MRSKQWMLLAPLAMVATVAAAAPAWVSTTAYTGGTTVSYAGQDWRAKWWTQGDIPGAAQWGPWEVVSSNPATPTPNVTLTPTPRVTATPTPVPGVTFWQASQAYTAGQVVCYGSSRFEAKWWVQGEVPDPANTWGPWKVISPCEILPVTPTPTSTPTPVIVTPTPTTTPTPPVTTIPNPLPSGTPVAINWTLTATNANSATVSWSVDTAQLAGAGVVPANWHVVFASVIPVLDSTSIWIGDDFINNKATYGGSGSIAGKMTVANLAYKLLVCNAAYTKCAESSSVLSFTGQVPVTPTPKPPTPIPLPTQTISAAKVETWRNGATGAYSIVHDDYCSYLSDTQIQTAEPALAQRGLVAAFAAITSQCDAARWASARTFIAHGHEIASHSRNHYDSSAANWVNSVEIAQSQQDIAANLDGYKATYFVWPSDTATDAALTYLRAQPGYLGARAANRDLGGGSIEYGHAAGVNSAQFDNPYAVLWDVFTNAGEYSIYPPGTGDILNLHVDAAIAQGGWATRTMHGVGTLPWEPVPVDRYLAHLDYVKSKVDAGLLWVGTPSDVIRYRFARNACAPVLWANGQGLDFPVSDPLCAKYATPITLDLTASGTSLPLLQGSKVINAQPLGNGHFRATVLPTAGSLVILPPPPQ